jgi:hypothetical protein
MNREKYYPIMLKLGAIWNFGLGGGLFLLILFQVDAWGIFGITPPENMMWMQGFLICVAANGLGPLAVARNLKENHAALQLGTIAKIGVFLLFSYYFWLGDVGVMLLVTGICDLIWAILYFEMMFQIKR